MDISIKDECFVDCISELEPIFKSHYDELITEKERSPYGPNYRSFIASENQGSLLFISIRDGAKMIGYMINLIAPSFEYKGILTCVSSFTYILPDYRKKSAGWQAMNYLEEKLKELGVQEWLAGYRVNFDLLGFYEDFGFHKHEVIMRKRIGD